MNPSFFKKFYPGPNQANHLEHALLRTRQFNTKYL